MIKHLIFTNLGIGIFDELWLLYRFEIFENTLLPSMENQTNKEFEWIIFIDKRLPEIFRKKIEGIQVKSDLFIKIIEVDDYSAISEETNKIIDNIDIDCLMTSRIDDDDCLHKSALELIKNKATNNVHKETISVISLKNGMEFLPSDNMMRPVDYETLALGLTLVDHTQSKKKKSVTHYAHHLILETLQKQGVKPKFFSIEGDYPLYLYTKHPLSDSFFFGARARILSDTKKISFDSFRFFDSYGLSIKNVKYLSLLLKKSPIGMPHKYLQKLGEIRTALKLNKDKDDNSIELKTLEARKIRYENVAVRPNPNKNSENNKIRIAIFGSCVSRDLFEIQKDLLSRYEVCFYSARSSIVSYMSLPNTCNKLQVTEKGFEPKRAVYDLEKSHWTEFELSKPDIVLIDFIDERIGLIKYNGSIFSASGPIIKSFERANISFEILRPWDAEIRKNRLWALKYFLERIRAICPNILIHKAGWAENYYDENNNVCSFVGSKFERLIELNNSILNELFHSIDKSDIPIDFVGGEVGMISANIHKWGFSPIHYDEKYYKTLANQLVVRVI